MASLQASRLFAVLRRFKCSHKDQLRTMQKQRDNKKLKKSFLGGWKQTNEEKLNLKMKLKQHWLQR